MDLVPVDDVYEVLILEDEAAPNDRLHICDPCSLSSNGFFSI